MGFTFDGDTKYLKWYFNIINKRRVELLDKSSNTDRHHVYPKFIFGKNLDLVRLTIREHILCHILLWKHFRKLGKIKETKSSWYTVCMTLGCAESKNRYFEKSVKKLANIIFEKREELSECFTGKNNPFFGKTHSEESRKKISEAGMKRITSKETKKLQSDSHKERVKNNPTCMNYLKEFNTGRALPKEHVEKIAQANRTHMFTIQTPENDIVITDELSMFCKDNNLSKGTLYMTLPGGSRESHKGFKLVEKSEKCQQH